VSGPRESASASGRRLDAENPAASRQLADRRVCLLVNTGCQKPFEVLSGWIDHRKRRVRELTTCQIAGAEKALAEDRPSRARVARAAELAEVPF